MQIRNGSPIGNTTCAVENGSEIVTAAAGSDWSQAIAGGFFSRNVDGDPVYEIAEVRAPGVNVSGRWELTLTGKYQGADNAALDYLIHKDFFANGSVMWNKGDTQFMAIQNRSNAKFDAALGSVANINPQFSNAQASPTDGSFQLFNEDNNLFHSLVVRGAEGESPTLQVVEAGEVGGGSGLFQNTRRSPSDGTFQIFNPDREQYHTISVVGAPGEEPTIEISETGEN